MAVEHIGSQVNVPGTRGKGILRYHGTIHGKTGIFAGIELLGPIALTRGKNCGDVEGFKYFEVQQPMTGLFIPFDRLKAVNPQIEYTKDMIDEISDNYNNNALDDDIEPTQGATSMEEYTGHVVVHSPIPTAASASNNHHRPYSADVSRSRFSNSPVLSSNRRTTQFDTRSRTSSMSSFSRSPVMNVAYRSASYNFDSKYNSNLKRYSNGSMTTLNTSGNSGGNTSFLEQELYDLRQKYEKSEREMSEKMSILNELKDTVQELQPVLKQYETELDERDRKIAKIRNEFESAREDWRQNLDIMVSTYESNENFYESKIRELQKKVNERSNDKNEEFVELKQKYDALVAEKLASEASFAAQIKELQTKLTVDSSKELNKKILEQQKEIEQLSNSLVELNKFPADNSNASRDKITKLEAEIEGLVHLKKRVEELEKENDELKADIERTHSFEKLEDKNSELNKLQDVISDLQEQVANKDKEITELEDSLDAKVKELSNISTSPKASSDDSKFKELQEDMFFKDQEIKALEQQLDKLGSINTNQKNHIKKLESKATETGNGSNDSRIKELEAEVERLKSESKGDKDLSKVVADKDQIIKELERKLQESLVNEIDSMNITDSAVIHEMGYMKEIEQLKAELNSRPSIEELTELQDNIDEMVRVHNNEIFFKQEEMQRLIEENNKLQTRLERALEGSMISNKIGDTSVHETVSVNSLPIYKPDGESDPSMGKDNWCGLCERDGHSSLNCPYENDIF